MPFEDLVKITKKEKITIKTDVDFANKYIGGERGGM